MSNITTLTRVTPCVRTGFTEQCVWRDALGGAEPLRVAVTDGPLDAPEHGPAGSTVLNVSYTGRVYGPATTYYHREG